MEMKNQTEIQLMKIMFKTNGKKATKKATSQRAYPHGIENQYYRELKGFFKPLTDYVEEYISKHMESLLRGDSGEIRLDTIPGQSFRNMIYNLENWLSVYMPDIADLPDEPYQNNNVILTTLGKTADEAMEFGEKEFARILEKGIHVNLPTTAEWWDDMKASWMEDNYTLITSNAKKYVSQINTLTEQAIVNGMSPGKLKKEIMKATEGLSDKHCKLLARDQMGKLNGQISQGQMEEVGLDLYVWSTAYDDRVRDSHALMEGLLCRWDDASVCSYDNGKTWVSRPGGAVDLHPGQDIQCRCVPLVFYPELVAEIEDKPMEEIIAEDELNAEAKKNLLEDLTDSERAMYDDVYNEFSRAYGFKSDSIDIAYACASGDFTKLPTSVFTKNSVDWDTMINRIGKALELSETKKYTLNEFNVARDIFQKGGKLPKFTCTEKELNDYITYLKKNNVLSSYDSMFAKNYGYEKYFAFAKQLGLSTAGENTYYRGLMDYFNFANKDLEKLVYEQFVSDNRIYGFGESKYLKYFDDALSRTNLEIDYKKFDVKHFMNLSPQVGTPWGTAYLSNDDYIAIAMFDHEITPFDKSTQKLITGLKVRIDSKTASYGISQKLYCEQNYPLTRKLASRDIVYKSQNWKYHTNEFLRMEFSYDGKPKNYKVGDILKQTGVFATSPSELHNYIWYQSKLKNGASYPVRFHLKRNKTSHKYLANVIQNDLHVANYTVNNPEEFDFAIGKVKVTKVKNGYINGDKRFPVQEVYVEIVE